jgi:hypothetical protein
MEATDDELVRALDKVTFDPRDEYDLVRVASFFDDSPEDKMFKRFKARIDANPEWKDLWESITDIHPHRTWPTFIFRIMFGMSRLSHHNRYHLIVFFWLNNLMPVWAIWWSDLAGLLTKADRRPQMEYLIWDLNRRAKCNHPSLADWHGFSMEKTAFVDLRARERVTYKNLVYLERTHSASDWDS